MNEESRPKAAPQTSSRSAASVTLTPSVRERDAALLDAVTFAWTTGYDLGVMHGRVAERALVEQERRSAVAGSIVRRLAALPEVDTAARARGRAPIRARLSGGGRS